MVINIRVNQSGQSLAEVMVALSISAVVLTALVIVVVNGLRNAQFAQNQVKATKAAQEAIEQIRSLRDRDVTIGGTGPTATRKLRDVINNNMCVEDGDEDLEVCFYDLFKSGSNIEIKEIDSPPDRFVSIPEYGPTFKRRIHIYRNPGPPPYNQKKVKVEVQWTDISGQHSSVLETILTVY